MTTVKPDTKETWAAFSKNPLDFYTRVAQDMKDAGAKDAPTLSRALEFASPSEAGQLDAFSRMMKAAGLRTKSDPVQGYWASEASDFLTTAATRALFTEYFAREWRKVAYAGPQERAVLLSSDAIPGSWERPWTDGGARWDTQLAPAIALSELIAMTSPITGDMYRSLVLEYDATQLRLFRIGEAAEIPIATVSARETTIRLHKYGRGLRTTYEEMRRMRIDKLGFFIRLMAVQSEMDKVAAGLDVIINGDGNTNTAAAVHNLTTLDSVAVAGTLTLKGWLAFKMKFTSPYALTTALMQEAVALQLALLNVGSANVPLAGANLGGMVQALQPINTTSDGVRYGWTSDAPALKIVAFDRRFEMEQVIEIGSSIAEMERYITNQTEVMTFSEVQGFGIIDPDAALILDVNA
jgi:hypothetical protein